MAAEGERATTTRALWLIGAIAVVASVAVANAYGGDSYWPALVTNFAASLAAFVLALSWERERERRWLEREVRATAERESKREAEQLALRESEVRRRLGPVLVELRHNAEQIEGILNALREPPSEGEVGVIVPQLLDGAWRANAPALTELMADYELTSDLSTAYGRVEELRWRLRERQITVAGAAGSEIARRVATGFHRFAELLAAPLLEDVVALVTRVEAQIEKPDVQPIGRVHYAAAHLGIAARITSAGTVRTQPEPDVE